MKKTYQEGKKRIKITATIDENVNKVFDEYIKDNDLYNKSNVIEGLIKKQINLKKE